MRGRMTAAVLACGAGGILSHWAAGAWWQLVEWDERAPEVTVRGGGGRKVDGIRVHRTRGLDRPDVWTRESILVTSPARTALDIAAQTSHKAPRRILRQAQAEGRVSVGQLRDVHTRADGHPGAPVLLAVIVDGPTPTRSIAEDLLLDLVQHAGLPRPEVIRRYGSAERRSCPISCGGRKSSSSKSTARSSTPAGRPERTMRASRRSSRPTATASCASAMRSSPGTPSRRSPASRRRWLRPAADRPRRRPSSPRRPRPSSSGPSMPGGSGA
jgi:hypothetical protein